jgi:arylformamidase
MICCKSSLLPAGGNEGEDNLKIHDISVEINAGLPLWPGDPKVRIERLLKIEEGANANISQMAMGLHTGTHVDAPWHFLADGVTLDKIPLDRFVGTVTVVEIHRSVRVLSGDTLTQLPTGLITEKVLFKTRNSDYWAEKPHRFHPDFIAIDLSGARFLIEMGVKLIGIDYLSIAPFRKGKETHEVLLGAGVVIVEGIDLSAVKQGVYQLFCLPLKLGGVEGAPARAILVEN